MKFTAYDVRERVSHTAIPLGSACVLLSAIQDSSRLRIPLLSRAQTTIGFLTISAWSLEAEDRGSSTEHTPCRVPSHNNMQVNELQHPKLNPTETQSKIANRPNRKQYNFLHQVGILWDFVLQFKFIHNITFTKIFDL